MAEQDQWNKRYESGETPWDTGKPSAELQRVVKKENICPCRVVELGCGTGTNALWLASQGFEVTGIDLSPVAIERARQRSSQLGVAVRWIAADLLDLPDLGEPFPFFFDRGCYHVVRRIDVSRFLVTLSRLTKPGSLGLVLTGNAREPHDPGPPVVEERELREELGQFFEIVGLQEFRFDQVEKDGMRFLGWSCFLRRRALLPN
ncbi:MAG TPA: methyltransferase domain-containing protein [Gemmataceae bacterium]|nr:methyltransferase domain-containing protein [Gemmataceae bacterium]